MSNIEIDDVVEARSTLEGKAVVTPVLAFHNVSTPGGNPIYIKAENVQPSGSFKIRGASYRISRLNVQQRKAGVIAYSTGNHAQAVALAAKLQGIQATIVMSPDAPAFKVEATRRYGAEVVMAESSSEKRRELAESLAETRGLALIPPYDHPDVLTGQATIGLELLEQLEHNLPAAIFVPVGGGGLISGVAAVVKQLAPDVRVIGVEPELENDAWQSFRAGHRVVLSASSNSIADAIRVQSLGELTYPLMRRYVDEIVTVSEADIAAATFRIVHEMHLFVEPSGALGLAAALQYAPALPAGQPVVCIASGGNTTLDALHDLLS
jgi:threonine dehydratase